MMSGNSNRQVKGSVIRGYLKYVNRTWGDQGIKELIEAIDIGLSGIEEQRWYDIGVLKNTQSWIAKSKGRKYVNMAGNYAVKDLGVLSYIVRFSDMRSLLKRASKSYHEAYNFGEVDIDIKDNSAVIRMKDVAFDEYACSAWKGAFQGMLEMTNTIGTVEETQCQRKGAPYCEFEIRWNK